jgi:hypothetical protein
MTEATDPWVASDSSTHAVKKSNYDPISLVSVALAVDDLSRFNSKYNSVISKKCAEYGIGLHRPVIKSHDINRFSPEWAREDALSDIVESLLQIDTIANVHFTETTLGEENDPTIPAYHAEDTPDVLGPNEVRRKVEPYYNLVPVWDYLRSFGDAPFGYHNVLVDDFGGKESDIWHTIGKEVDELRVAPKGDQIYPLLSMTDLIMSYIAQEVSEWDEDTIHNHLEEITPKKSAFAAAQSIDSKEDLQKIVPRSHHPAKTEIHYAHPVIYIEKGSRNKDRIQTTRAFDLLCDYANTHQGCVKFFNEDQDLKYMTSDDYMVSFDADADMYKKYNGISGMVCFDTIGPEEIVSVFESD